MLAPESDCYRQCLKLEVRLCNVQPSIIRVFVRRLTNYMLNHSHHGEKEGFVPTSLSKLKVLPLLQVLYFNN